jgi:hypothetical protein
VSFVIRRIFPRKFCGKASRLIIICTVPSMGEVTTVNRTSQPRDPAGTVTLKYRTAVTGWSVGASHSGDPTAVVTTIEVECAELGSAGDQVEGPQREILAVNAYIPDICLVVGILQQAGRTGDINTLVTGLINPLVRYLP